MTARKIRTVRDLQNSGKGMLESTASKISRTSMVRASKVYLSLVSTVHEAVIDI